MAYYNKKKSNGSGNRSNGSNFNPKTAPRRSWCFFNDGSRTGKQLSISGLLLTKKLGPIKFITSPTNKTAQAGEIVFGGKVYYKWLCTVSTNFSKRYHTFFYNPATKSGFIPEMGLQFVTKGKGFIKRMSKN